jgi:glycosyltransferase involved in cell wall biosynthesis
VVELDAPLRDLVLPPARSGDAYRSLLLVVRLDGAPVGLTALDIEAGGVSRERLSEVLDEEFDAGYVGFEPVPAAARLPPISVVVPTCGDPVVLERCVRSILACDYREFEVIVVDNRPDSPAAAILLFEQFADDPRVRYVEEPRPGASWARNAGLAVADGEIVAFADDDVVVDSAWLQRCAAAFERSDDVACVTGLILPFELETPAQLLFEQLAGLSKGFEPQIFRRAAGLQLHRPGAMGSGANAAIRADVGLALGGFDTTLGPRTPTFGAEDLDLFTRVVRAGYAVAYEPRAMVWHEHPDGMNRLNRQAFRYGVGLGGMLGRQFFTGPDRLELLRAVPSGMRQSLDRGARRNAAKRADYPRRLDWLERAGLLVGPFAYIASRLLTAPPREQLGARGADDHTGTAVVERLPLGAGRSVKVLSFRAPETAPARPLGAPARRAVPRAAPGAIAVAAAVACVAAPLLVAMGAPGALRLPAVLALLCLAPGAALLRALGARIEAGLVLGLSLAADAVASQVMLWLGAWSPEGAIYALAAVCVMPLFVSVQAWSPRLPAAQPIMRVRRLPRHVAAHMALVALALIAWGTSVAGADLSEIDGFGLVSALPPGYFIAIGLLIIGFVAAVSRPIPAPRLLGVYVVALIVVIHATAPLLYGEPRYVWTFKHLGVIDYIGQSGAANRDVDIYNNWPAFFALNAWLSHAANVSAATYAEWAQLFFNLVNVVALRFALRGLTRDDRLIWTATWLFVLANFVGQDYLAPQAFGFTVSLVTLGACLRLAPPEGPPLPRRAALLAIGLGGVAVILSHQLSPVMLILSVAALALIAKRVPLWIPLALAAVEVWWVALAWPFLSRHFVLFDPNPAESARPSGGDGLPGLAVVSHAPWAGAALMLALAGVGLVRRRRAGHWDLAAVALVIGPLAVAGVQSYGGEGRVRLFLFMLPWLCFLAAAGCAQARSTRLRGWLRGWRLALASVALAICLVFAYFGSEYINRISRNDVEAARWFEAHAPSRSSLASVIGPFPDKLTARYPVVYANAVTVVKDSSYRSGHGPRLNLATLERDLHELRRPRFVVVSPSEQRYARLYGLLPDGTLARLDHALGRSRAFRLVHRRGATSIYEDMRPLRGGG